MVLIKQICYNPDNGRLILSDSENNHYLCDIYGNKLTDWVPYVSGFLTGKTRKKLAPLMPQSPVLKSSNYVEYIPISRKFEGYSQFPRPIVPPFSNLSSFEISNSGKKELIEQLQKFFTVDKVKDILNLKNENNALDYLTCSLNEYDSVKEDSNRLLEVIEETFEEYRKIYKYKLNILDRNPVVRALKQFKKVLLTNGSVKVINGRRLKEPSEGIRNNYNANSAIISNIGLKKKKKITIIDSGPSVPNVLSKSENGEYTFSKKKLRYCDFLYEKINQEEQEEEKKEEKKDEKKDSKQPSLPTSPPKKEEEKEPLKPDEEAKNEEQGEEKKEEEKKEEGEHKEEEVEEEKPPKKDPRNISFMSNETQNEFRYARENVVPIKSVEMVNRQLEHENLFLPGFKEEVIKETGIIRKSQKVKFKTNGDLFFENLALLKLTNPIAFKLQEQKDMYDFKQLQRKVQQMRIHQNNLGHNPEKIKKAKKSK